MDDETMEALKMANPELPAFPINDVTGNEGLTKRECFAAMAMQGACADTACKEAHGIAEFAVKCADCLLAELAKEQETEAAESL